MKKLQSQSRIAFRVTMALSEAAQRPPFRAPNPALAVYQDALSLVDVFGRAQVDLHLFPVMDQLVIQQTYTDLQEIVQAGPDAFDSNAVITTLNAALQGIGAVTRLPCQKF